MKPCPDSLLINGLGYFDCSMATPGAPVNCSEIEKPWLSLDKKKRYRIRLVNVGYVHVQTEFTYLRYLDLSPASPSRYQIRR